MNLSQDDIKNLVIKSLEENGYKKFSSKDTRKVSSDTSVYQNLFSKIEKFYENKAKAKESQKENIQVSQPANPVEQAKNTLLDNWKNFTTFGKKVASIKGSILKRLTKGIVNAVKQNPKDKIRLLAQIASVPTGIAAGNAFADYENEHFFTYPGTQRLAKFMDPATLAIALPLLLSKSPQGKMIGAGGLLALAGPKQSIMYGMDKATDASSAIKSYTDSQDTITKKLLDTAVANLETSKASLDTAINQKAMSEKWLNFANKYFPYTAAGAGAALLGALGLYAYNSFKKRKHDDKGSNLSLEIPAEKISPKFYNSLGREILFKDKDEEKRENALNKAASTSASQQNLDNDLLDFNKIQSGATALGVHDWTKRVLNKTKNLPALARWSILNKGYNSYNEQLPTASKLINTFGPILLSFFGANSSDFAKNMDNPVNSLGYMNNVGDMSKYLAGKYELLNKRNPLYMK